MTDGAVQERVSQIEDAVAAGTMSAGQVFTQMRQLVSRISGGSPPGWKLVPVEPTEEMLDHAWGMVIPTPGYPLEEWAAVYRAMLSASPPPDLGTAAGTSKTVPDHLSVRQEGQK